MAVSMMHRSQWLLAAIAPARDICDRLGMVGPVGSGLGSSRLIGVGPDPKHWQHFFDDLDAGSDRHQRLRGGTGQSAPLQSDGYG